MINYESTKLDEPEEQTLRYVVGFVFHKLFGLVKHKEKPEGKVTEQKYVVRKRNLFGLVNCSD